MTDLKGFNPQKGPQEAFFQSKPEDKVIYGAAAAGGTSLWAIFGRQLLDNPLKPVTVWKKFNPDSQKWDHNHIEDFHIGTMAEQYLKPIGDENQTENWSSSTWLHEHKHLKNGKVV